MVNQMTIDEELLKPSRERLASLRAQIADMEVETVEKIKRCGDGAIKEDLWRNFNLAVEPLRREHEAILKVMTDYYALQPMPPVIIRKLGH